MDRYVKGYRDISPEGNMYVWIVYLDRRTWVLQTLSCSSVLTPTHESWIRGSSVIIVLMRLVRRLGNEIRFPAIQWLRLAPSKGPNCVGFIPF
jgi:hypothetical protein